MDASRLALLQRLFDFHAEGLTPSQTKPADVAFTFGRQDRRVAETAVTLWQNASVARIMVTGGVGKDSGDLATRGQTEADWLADQMEMLGVPRDPNIIVEPKASHGGENCSFGLDAIQYAGIHLRSLIIVVHATSARRLTTQLRDELEYRGLVIPVQTVPTDYPFDPANPADAAEALAELNRLVNWPNQTNPNGRPFLSRHPVPEEFLALL